MRLFFSLVLLAFLCGACNQPQLLSPKPRAYPKVEYPERSYLTYANDQCPFSFTYPAYGSIEAFSSSLPGEEQMANDCWFDLRLGSFNGQLHCSYFPINSSRKSLDELKRDAFELVDYHNKRANYIDELVIDRSPSVRGLLFSIEGPAATPLQFFLTDETDHFFRASLYFNTEVRPDSIAPIVEFVREDVLKLIETFEWTK